MIESNLVLALGVHLEHALKDLILPTKTEGCFRAPRVIDGYLPPKRTLGDDDFPFVIVRAEGGVSELEVTTVTVSLIIGCYTTETDGYSHCMEIMQRIRKALCELPCGVLERKYQLEYPISWSNIPDHPYPQWQLEMTTKWIINTPQMTKF